MRVVTREMSISHSEFRRILGRAFSGEFRQARSDRFEFDNEGGRIRIDLAQESSARLGVMTIPVTTVSLEFHDMDPVKAQAFLVRFDRAFQRGGG
jgi:hypothetical protein